jgi:hypothetical protein
MSVSLAGTYLCPTTGFKAAQSARANARRERLLELVRPLLRPDGTLPNGVTDNMARALGWSYVVIASDLKVLRLRGELPMIRHKATSRTVARTAAVERFPDAATVAERLAVERQARMPGPYLERRPESTLADWVREWKRGTPARSYIREQWWRKDRDED